MSTTTAFGLALDHASPRGFVYDDRQYLGSRRALVLQMAKVHRNHATERRKAHRVRSRHLGFGFR